MRQEIDRVDRGLRDYLYDIATKVNDMGIGLPVRLVSLSCLAPWF